jgi:hypothetical protein
MQGIRSFGLTPLNSLEVQFFPIDHDINRGFDSDSDLVAVRLDDCDDDSPAIDHDSFVTFPADD